MQPEGNKYNHIRLKGVETSQFEWHHYTHMFILYYINTNHSVSWTLYIWHKIIQSDK